LLQARDGRFVKSHRLWRGVAAVVLALVIGWGIWQRQVFSAEHLEALVSSFGLLAPLAFVALYVVTCLLALPGSLMTMLAGALFGPVLGTLYGLTGATLGATAAFLIARYIASDWVAATAGGRLKRLVEGVESEGWRFVAFVRLVPLFPFSITNFAFGLTRLPVLPYFGATFVCMAPAAIVFAYLGFVGREAMGGGGDLAQKALLALSLLAAIALIPVMVRHRRRQKLRADQ
jgi:uncharacterized membrane protein YdjX (TVP38/TMEM64 family)